MTPTKPLDTAAPDALPLRASGLGAKHPDCVSGGQIGEEIKMATSWGGTRPGAGRPRQAPPQPAPRPALIWCCVETLNRRELQVVWELKRLGLETFLALYLPRPTKAKPQPILEPAFPRYVFVRVALAQSAWRTIHQCRGVLHLLQHDPEHPMAVSDAVMSRLVRDYGEGGRATAPEPERARWARLTPVRVTDGPFAGFDGHVLRDDGDRVRVSVHVFGREVECEMPWVAVALQ